MQRHILFLTVFVLFIGHAEAQSALPEMAPNTPSIAVPSGGSTAVASPALAPPENPGLSVFAAQREQQAARLMALRKDIGVLEAQLLDPRATLRTSIEAITGIEAELIRTFVSASGDTEWVHRIETMVADLAGMRIARMRQLSAADTLDPIEAERIRRQWLNKQDELRAAEMLLAGIEKQLNTLRADRELGRRAQDLTELMKTIPAPTATIAIPPAEDATRRISKP